METVSLWKALATDKPSYPMFDKTIDADVVFVGGGITGLTAALYLVEGPAGSGLEKRDVKNA